MYPHNVYSQFASLLTLADDAPSLWRSPPQGPRFLFRVTLCVTSPQLAELAANPLRAINATQRPPTTTADGARNGAGGGSGTDSWSGAGNGASSGDAANDSAKRACASFPYGDSGSLLLLHGQFLVSQMSERVGRLFTHWMPQDLRSEESHRAEMATSLDRGGRGGREDLSSIGGPISEFTAADTTRGGRKRRTTVTSDGPHAAVWATWFVHFGRSTVSQLRQVILPPQSVTPESLSTTRAPSGGSGPAVPRAPGARAAARHVHIYCCCPRELRNTACTASRQAMLEAAALRVTISNEAF